MACGLTCFGVRNSSCCVCFLRRGERELDGVMSSLSCIYAGKVYHVPFKFTDLTYTSSRTRHW